MSLPQLLPERCITIEEWQRRAKDLVNMIAKRLMSTGDRPPNPVTGTMHYDAADERPYWWSGMEWRGAQGPSQLVTVSANHAVTATESAIVNNKSGSGMTLTLPSAAAFPGREITVKTLQAQLVVSASSNVAPINSATAGTAILPATAGAWCRLKSSGSAWNVMARGT